MTTPFKLDDRLDNDCFVIGESDTSLLLLMNNSLVPWFILVPRTDRTEIHELDKETRLAVFDETNALAEFVKKEFGADKINTAAIGNVVRQLHIHVIGRKVSDFCWPGVVWGAKEKKEYDGAEVISITENVKRKLQDRFRTD